MRIDNDDDDDDDIDGGGYGDGGGDVDGGCYDGIHCFFKPGGPGLETKKSALPLPKPLAFKG